MFLVWKKRFKNVMISATSFTLLEIWRFVPEKFLDNEDNHCLHITMLHRKKIICKNQGHWVNQTYNNNGPNKIVLRDAEAVCFGFLTDCPTEL